MKVISEEQIHREVLEDCRRDGHGRRLGQFEWESPIEMVGYVREQDGLDMTSGYVREAFGHDEYLGDYSFYCKGCQQTYSHWLTKAEEFDAAEE